jgi:hypothetical protein
VDNLRIIIKPKGLIALTVVIAAAMLGIAAPQFKAHRDAKGAPVGAASVGGSTAEAADLNTITDPGELEEKGMIRDWNKAPGQAHDWLFLGPLASGSQIKTKSNEQNAQAQMDRIVNSVYLPNEAKYQAKENATFNLYGKTYSWRKVHGSAFDFKDMYSGPQTPVNSLKDVVVYGVTEIDSPEATTKIMHFRSDDGAIVWLNGDQVFKTTKIRGVRPEDTFPVKLRAGKNTLLVKVGQGDGGWGLMVHLQDAKDGTKTK